jgi:putative transcriptional regulator
MRQPEFALVEDLENRGRGVSMNDELFDELVASLKEGSAILQGTTPAARSFDIKPVDVKQIRNQYHLTQREFAAMLGVSVRTLQNWEQGRRAPDGPARVLLQVAARHPQAVLDTVQAND